jgi:hypothetical protein
MGRYGMTIKEVLFRAEKLVQENSTTILTAVGVSGTITTAYLASKASFKVGYRTAINDDRGINRPSAKEFVQAYWRLYIPPVASGGLTIVAVISAAKINSRRAAALTAAYSLSEKAYSEYKDKVVETLGERKEKKVRDEIAADQVNNNPPQGVVMLGSGDILCCELWTGRYFNSDMEAIRKAVNVINSKLNRDDNATLSDFYDLIGLPNTTSSSYSGWNSDKLLDLNFSTQLHEGKPCLAFEYNYIKPC